MEKETVDKTRIDFFKTTFGETRGFVCIAHQEPIGGIFQQEFFYWPDNRNDLLRHIQQIEKGHNVWFCPMLFARPQRKKDAVEEVQAAWADLDECDPTFMDEYAPPLVLETSPGRFHGIWPMDTVMPPSVAEDYSHRIAYKYKEQGADQSGWDLTQLLRVPYTYNYKYRQNGSLPPKIELYLRSNDRVDVNLLDGLPLVPNFSANALPLPTRLPDLHKSIERIRLRLPDGAYKLINIPPDSESDWSKLLYHLELQLFEAGATKEEVYVICASAACNKFARDRKPAIFLWQDVLRAEVKWRHGVEVVPEHTLLEIPALTGENEFGTQTTFVKDYVAWASTKTDAAVQYHEATAFIILSALLAGNLHIELEFGTIKPNLWIMLIADTTLTRKSTAMEMGVELLKTVYGDEKEYDPVLATDGSVEGLFTAMQGRSGRPSLFLKDEFTGLMDSIAKKDFMAGMLEFLTKLYDGTEQKRVLKKETVTIRNPILIIFAGGIKNKLFSILRDEHISSGFLPRFIIISAESDVDKRRPIQRRSDIGTEEREALIRELAKLKDLYSTPIIVKLPGSDAQVQQYPTIRVDFTDEALQRLDTIERTLVEAGMTSEQPDAYVPMFDRLAKSCMKMAALIAACRQEPVEDTIYINEADVIAAAKYIERWSNYTIETLRNVGKTFNERILDRVLGFIRKYPDGVQRSVIMNNQRITADEMGKIITNLEMRGLITTNKKGKGLWLYPVLDQM